MSATITLIHRRILFWRRVIGWTLALAILGAMVCRAEGWV